MVRQIFLVIVSIIIALLLTIIPLPGWINWLRPAWGLLVVGIWLVLLPDYVGIGIAWVVGLLLDLLQGTLLGEHALALVVTSYLLLKFHRQFQTVAMYGQMILIGVLSFIYLAIIFWIQGLIGQLSFSLNYWLAIFTTMICWPWLYWLVYLCHQRSIQRSMIKV